MASVEVALIGFVLLGVGAVGMWTGIKRREAHELITETPTTEVGRLSESGTVELKGRVTASDEGPGAFTSRIDRREGVLSVWKVEEWDERGDYSNWKTIATGVQSVPFVLDDGTGEVLVEVGDHTDSGGLLRGVSSPKASDGVSFGDVMVEIDQFDVVEEVGAEDPTPGHIRDFVTLHGAVEAQSGSMTNVLDVGNAHGDRRYHETTFAEGDELYVLGQAYPRDPNPAHPLRPEELVVTVPQADDDGMLIVSNESEQELVKGTRYYLLWLVGGAITLAAGFVLIGAGL